MSDSIDAVIFMRSVNGEPYTNVSTDMTPEQIIPRLEKCIELFRTGRYSKNGEPNIPD